MAKVKDEQKEEKREEVLVTPLVTDFGREDLNQLRDTVNAIIAKVN